MRDDGDTLADYRGTLALISHDRYLLNALTEVIYEVAGGAVTRYAGSYAWYAEERVRRRDQVQRLLGPSKT